MKIFEDTIENCNSHENYQSRWRRCALKQISSIPPRTRELVRQGRSNARTSTRLALIRLQTRMRNHWLEGVTFRKHRF